MKTNTNPAGMSTPDFQTPAEFFSRDDIKALQQVQKVYPSSSPEHRAATRKIAALAALIGGDLSEE